MSEALREGGWTEGGGNHDVSSQPCWRLRTWHEPPTQGAGELGAIPPWELMGGFWGACPGHPNTLPLLAASRHHGLSAAAATLPVVPGPLEPIQPRTFSGPPWLPLPGSLGCPQPPPHNPVASSGGESRDCVSC